MLVGAYGNEEGGDGAGAAYIVPGASVTSGSLGDEPAIKLIGGKADCAGEAVSYVGDQDGDGYDDLLVGAWTNDEGGAGAGAALLVLVPTSADMHLSAADARLVGEASEDHAGLMLGDAGDLNDDGAPDLWVGAPGTDGDGSDSGTLYFVFGPTSASLSLGAADAQLFGTNGSGRASAGDTDGDGYSDLLIGRPDLSDVASRAGAAYLVLGPLSGSADTEDAADALLQGETTYDRAGSSVDLADLDGDGYDDPIVGAYLDETGSITNAGVVYGVFGPAITSMTLSVGADLTLSGAEASGLFGRSASAGDVDRDGVVDLLVSAISASEGGSGAGTVYLFYGPLTGGVTADMADARYTGEYPDDALGMDVCVGDDISGDGRPDLLIGASSGDDRPGLVMGAAYVIYP